MFCPGETVVHQFNIPFAVNDISKVIVTYKQRDHIVKIIPVDSGFTQGESEYETAFSVTLSQNDTLLFEERCPYKAQLNVLTVSGTRSASDEMWDETGPQQYKEVI